MDLTVAKRDFLKLLTRAQSIAANKSTMPILANILLDASGDFLRISATDLYLAISGQVAAKVTSPGAISVGGKDLVERVKAMPDGPVHISTSANETLTLKAAGSARKYNLRGIAAADFPPMPAPAEGSASSAMGVAVLLDLITRTQASISGDETRAHLNSLFVEWEGSTVRAVSTDGHRLSKYEVKVDGVQTASMLIPLKAVNELRRLCEGVLSEREESPKFAITQSGSNAYFRNGKTTFSVRLVEATFPPYAQVIPKANTSRAVVPRAALADAVRAVSLAAGEKTGGVKFAFAAARLTVTSESPDHGDASDELTIDFEGPPVTIGFNGKYVLDALASLDEDDVSVELKADLEPATIKPISDRGFLAVVMPVRI